MQTFLGATETVTGSKYLLTFDTHKILVDCGLFQGYKELRLRNWNKLPLDPRQINAVILTHAHIDYSGYLPLLVKNGFTGPIYTTQATQDLCSILLPDSAYLQEEEARYANLHGFSKHHPALPLYTRKDAEKALTQFVVLPYNEKYRLFADSFLKFFRAGHILGSAFVSIQSQGRSILFSGDIGRPHDPIMLPPTMIQNTDYLVVESSYGDRLHDKISPQVQLKKIINETAKRCFWRPFLKISRSRKTTVLIYRSYQGIL